MPVKKRRGERDSLFVVGLIAIVLVGLVVFISLNVGGMTGGVIGVSWIGNFFSAGKITGNAVNLDSGLVAYYNFEGDVKDKSRTGNNGINHGVTFVESKEGLGEAGRFYGKEYVVLNKDPAIANLSKGTISVWALYNNNSILFEQMLSTYNAGFVGTWYLGRLYSPYTVFGIVPINYSNTKEISFGDDYATGWNHYLVVWDGTTIKGYFNGEYVSSVEQLPDNEVITTGVYNSAMGGFSQGPVPETGFFYGLIDEARIYNRALSEEEIDELYDFRESVTPVVNETVIPENFTEENETETNESIVNITIPEIFNQSVIPENKSEERKESVPENKSEELVKPCELVGARWENEKADVGERVKLVLEAENCDGNEARFVVEEYDELSANDGVESEPKDVIIQSGRAETYWNAEWQCDGARVFGECIGGKPEYKFTVSVNPEIESENLLSVSESAGGGGYAIQGSEGNPELMALIEKTPVCGDGIVQIGEECEDWELGSGACSSDCKLLGRGDCSEGYARNITQWNITWIFDACYRVGMFANGDWWVKGPVTITGITPDYVKTTSIDGSSYCTIDSECTNLPMYNDVTGAYKVAENCDASYSNNCKGTCNKMTNKCTYSLHIHGFELNPFVGPGIFVSNDNNPADDPEEYYASQHGLDGRVYLFNESLVPSLPLTINKNSSILKAVSQNRDEQYYKLRTAGVLTVLDEVPIDNGATLFRPPYVGDDKKFYSVREIKIDILPSVPPLGAVVPFKSDDPYNPASYFKELRRVQVAHKGYTVGINIIPSSNGHDYQLDEAAAVDAPASAQLTFNYPLAEKAPLLFSFLQKGIDVYEVVNETKFEWRAPDLEDSSNRGTIFGFGGIGVAPAFLLPPVFAAALLNNTNMKTDLARRPWINEKRYINIGYRGVPIYGGNYSIQFGYQGHVDRYWANVVLGPLGDEVGDPYSYIDGGWHGGGGSGYMTQMNDVWRSFYIFHLIPEMMEAYNGTALIYSDRWIGYGQVAQPDMCAPPIGKCSGPYNEGRVCTLANEVDVCRGGDDQIFVNVSVCIYGVCDETSGNPGMPCGGDPGYYGNYDPVKAGNKVWYDSTTSVPYDGSNFNNYNFKYCGVSHCKYDSSFYMNYSSPHGYGPDPRYPPTSANVGNCIYDNDSSDGIGRVPYKQHREYFSGDRSVVVDTMINSYKVPYCFDRVCNGDENYASCPADCDPSLKLRLDFSNNWSVPEPISSVPYGWASTQWSAGILHDKSGYGNDATCQKPFIYWDNNMGYSLPADQCPGQATMSDGFTKAAVFSTTSSCDIAGDYFAIPNSQNSVLNNLAQGTISLWVNYATLPRGSENDLITTMGFPTQNTWTLGGQTAGSPGFLYSTSSAYFISSFQFSPIQKDQWNLYTITWNGTNIAGYLNGVKDAEALQVIPMYSLNNEMKYLAIGTSPHNNLRNIGDLDTCTPSKCLNLCPPGCNTNNGEGCPYDPWDNRAIYNGDGSVAMYFNWTCCKDPDGNWLPFNYSMWNPKSPDFNLTYFDLFPKYTMPNNGFFNGMMSDIRIYNRSLGTDEVSFYYERTKSSYAPAVCGNNILQIGEVCDRTQLGGKKCSDFEGFNYGTLRCNSSCTGWDTSYCSAEAQTCSNCELIFGAGCDADNCHYLGSGDGRHNLGDCYYTGIDGNKCELKTDACLDISSCEDSSIDECSLNMCGNSGLDCRKWGVKCTEFEPSLVLHYDFEDNLLGGIVPDKSGYEHDGRCGASWWTGGTCPAKDISKDESSSGKFDRTLKSFIDTGFLGQNKISSGTIALWVNYGDTYESSNLISTYGAYQPGTWFFGKFENYMTAFVVVNSTGNDVKLYFPDTNVINKWNHYVVSWDDNAVRIYFNGEQVGSALRSGIPELTSANLGSYYFIRIGGRTHESPPESGFFSGKMDDLMIYNRSLSSNEIISLYAESKGIPQFMVGLNSPANNLLTNAVPTSFTCSASYNTTISNLALYGDWTGAWKFNETKVASNGAATFTKSLPEGTFKWNCLATADTGETKFASSNYTIVVDRTAPTIIINSPANTNYSNRIIGINIGLNEAGSCTYRVNASDGEHAIANIAGTNYGGNTAPLPNGAYSFRVTCADLAGNSGTGYVTFGVNSSSICGDGKIDAGDEECDGTNITASCQYGGSVSCTSSCAVDYTLCNSAPVGGGGNGGGGGSGGGSKRVNNTQGTNNSNIGASGNKGEGTDEGINVTKIIETLGGGNTPMRKSVGTIIFVGIMAVLVGGIVFLSIVIVRKIRKMKGIQTIARESRVNLK